MHLLSSLFEWASLYLFTAPPIANSVKPNCNPAKTLEPAASAILHATGCELPGRRYLIDTQLL